MSKSVAVITGSSSGIGLATVRRLSLEGYSVVATARRPNASEALHDLAAQNRNISLRSLDVTNPGSTEACITSVIADFGAIDLLVNNAGGGCRGSLEQLSMAQIMQAFDVNVFGALRVTKAVIPVMRAAGSGRIISVTSLNGLFALPFSDAYNGAKFALEGVMQGLAPVLRHFNIFVSVVEPGPVRTRFFEKVVAQGTKEAGKSHDAYNNLLHRFNHRMAELGANGQSAESVAEVIWSAAVSSNPVLRYQTSEHSQTVAAQILIDPTGTSVFDASSSMLA